MISTRISASAWVAIALVSGLGTGIALRATELDAVPTIVSVAGTIGTLWVNAIRMTVIPLIVSLLIVGIASPARAGDAGPLGARAFVFFYAALALVAGGTALIAPPIFSLLTLDEASVTALRDTAGGAEAVQAAATMPGFGDWLLSVVPTNPFQAAADGALLPLIVFILAFGYALCRVEEPGRASVVSFFRGVADAMMVLVRWVLVLTPVGVFTLTLVLGTRLGGAVVGAIGFYVVVQIALLVAAGIAMYPTASVLGRIPLREFARAVAPAQVVAASTRSSFAALPAGLDGAKRVLGIPAEVAGFVMPLAVAVFRYSSPIQWLVGALFVAELYGIPFGPVQVATVAVASVLLNATVPGIPSGGLLVQAPVYTAVGLPVEGLAILIAVDLFPDVFRTASNVTGHLAAVAAVSGVRTEPVEVPPGVVARAAARRETAGV